MAIVSEAVVSAFDKPFIVGASVLSAGAHGETAGHTFNLHPQEVVRALAGVFSPSMADQAQVRTAAIVHEAGIVYYETKSQGSIYHNLPSLSKDRAAIV